MRRAAAAAGALLLGLVPATAAEPGDLCGRFGPGTVAGRVEAPLTEISGVVASTRHPGVLWVHDDSGGEPAVTAVAEDGTDLGTYELPGAPAFDWEDIALAGGALFVGDIGDNRAARTSVTVYRASEPDVRPDGRGGALSGVEAFELRYPGGPVDAEALLVDPVHGDLLILTKEAGISRVLRAPAAALVAGQAVLLEEAARFRVPRPASRVFGLPGIYVTGADVAPDGSFVLVRTYRSVLAFPRAPGAPLHEAFASTPCEVPQVEELQGEAIAVLPGGDGYVTIGEGAAAVIHRFERVAASPTTPVERTPAADVEGDGRGAGTARRGLALAVAVPTVLVVLSLLGVGIRRRTGAR